MSVFEHVTPAPADPILGLTDAFVKDDRPGKVNLGVGVYLDEDGRIPLLDCVRRAERSITEAGGPHGYLPIDGFAQYVSATRELVFGSDSPAVSEGRVVTVETLGGTGALKVGGDFLRQLDPGARLLISSPSWENHRAVFTRAGFEVGEYRYYSREAHGVDVDGMLEDLRAAAPGTVVVLHACCHNPTGYDLTDEQWDRVVEVVVERGLVAFVDMAYQGFGAGLQADGVVIGKLLATGQEFLVATSFSKSFNLYGQRIGALHLVTASAERAAAVLSQVKVVIRTNYSNPPRHGAEIVARVLGDEELRALWEEELRAMRERIASLREMLVAELRARGVEDMDFIAAQRGMFSYSGLSKEQMQRLRADHAVYGTDAGRMCVAALNQDNVAHVADAIAEVRQA